MAGIEFYNEISVWRVPVMSLLRVGEWYIVLYNSTFKHLTKHLHTIVGNGENDLSRRV